MSRVYRLVKKYRRQRRYQKLALLRGRYTAAKTETERQGILAKVQKISPGLALEQFLIKKPA